MGLENYVPVNVRLKQFRDDNKAKKVLVKTTVKNLDLEKEAAMIEAEIFVDDVLVANAHALAPDLGENKGFEKAETSAVGRALANLGYEADDGEGESEGKSEKSSKGGLGKGGLGKGGLGKSKAAKEEKAESKDEADGEEAEEEKAPAKAATSPKSKLPPAAKKVEKEEVEEEEEASEEDGEESDGSDEAEEESAAPAKAAAPAAPAKLGGIMAKYGLGGAKK